MRKKSNVTSEKSQEEKMIEREERLEENLEEKRELKKAAFYRMLLDKREPPRAMIGEEQEDEE